MKVLRQNDPKDAGSTLPIMRILITGIAGFIGSNLARRMSAISDVIGLDDLSTGNLKNLDGVNCRLLIGSVLDQQILSEAIEGCNAIVHLAARPSVARSVSDPYSSHEANATGTLRVLQAAQGLQDPLVIVASSSSVYGANPTLPKHESLLPMPMSPYAVSKLATEQYALSWQHSFSMRTLALRFFNVFGPHQEPGHAYAAVVPSFIWAALHDAPLAIFGDGLQSRDFTYVGTVCDVIADALERNVSHNLPVNLAYGTRTSLVDLVSLLEDITDKPLRVKHLANRPGDVRHSQADNTTLRQLFPSVTPISLRDGLTKTLDWMANSYSQVPRS